MSLIDIEHKAIKDNLDDHGFAIQANVYSKDEVDAIIACIEQAESSNDSFLKTKELFAIRQLLRHIPELEPLIFTSNLKALLTELSNQKVFLTKSIYFDKPSESNWFVAYHQDSIISVEKKVELDGYCNWTNKKSQIGVQPPLDVLENAFTIRIHLDETTSENGALIVIPKSHKMGFIRMNEFEYKSSDEVICEVPKGGIMLMKPLTLHASKRTTNGNKRRVIHLEFNSIELAEPIQWLEKMEVFIG